MEGKLFMRRLFMNNKQIINISLIFPTVLGSVLFSDGQDPSLGIWEFNVSVLKFYFLLKSRGSQRPAGISCGHPSLSVKFICKVACCPPSQHPHYAPSFSGTGPLTACPPVDDIPSPLSLCFLSLSTCSAVPFPLP